MCEPVLPSEVAALLREHRRIAAGDVSAVERADYLAWKDSVFERLDALAAERAARDATRGGDV